MDLFGLAKPSAELHEGAALVDGQENLSLGGLRDSLTVATLDTSGPSVDQLAYG